MPKRGAFERELIRNGVLVRGQQGILTNLKKYERGVIRNIKQVTSQARGETVRLAKSVSPYKTGRMQKSITGELFPSGLGFSVFYDPAQFILEGLPYYPVWVELGTSRMGPRPTITWAFDIISPIYANDVAQILRRSTR